MSVLITGASRGIGRAIALKLQDHYSLILHASTKESLDSVWNELKDKKSHIKLCADLSDKDALKEFCTRLKKEYSKDLQAVINNAGISLDKPIMFQPEADIDKMLQVNLKAPIMISKAAFKIFHSSQKGVIINISSCVGEIGNSFQSVYAATKAGLVAFSKSLARETGMLLPNHSIRIFSVSPGFIDTDMTDKIPEAYRKKYIENIPANRLGQPSEVANVIAFLLSDEASYINGSEIKINGGVI